MLLSFPTTSGCAPSPLRGEGGVRGAAVARALALRMPPQPSARCTTEPLTRLARAPLRGTERADLSPEGRGERKSGAYSCVC